MPGRSSTTARLKTLEYASSATAAGAENPITTMPGK
jgi:hypothetical protein